MPIQNNNPGNIEYIQSDDPWEGSNYKEGRFESFVDLPSGYRALGKTLNTYYRLHGLNTTEGILNRYSPSKKDGKPENDTPTLIANANKRMSDMLGQDIQSDTPLNLNDPKIGEALMRTIAFQENSIDPMTEHPDEFSEGLQAIYGEDADVPPIAKHEQDSVGTPIYDVYGQHVSGRKPVFDGPDLYDMYGDLAPDQVEGLDKSQVIKNIVDKKGSVLAMPILQAATGQHDMDTWEILEKMKPNEDISDEQYVRGLYHRYGGKLSRKEFNQAIGYSPSQLAVGTMEGVAGVSDAMSAIANQLGFKGDAEFLSEAARSIREDNPPARIAELGEIEDPWDFFAVAGYHIGAQSVRTAGQIGTIIGAGAIGGPVAGLAVGGLYNYAFQFGEQYNELKAQGIDDAALAAKIAAPSALLDLFPQQRIAGVITKAAKLKPGHVMRARGKIYKDAAKELGIISGSEGITEAAQSLIHDIGVSIDQGTPLDLDEAGSKALEALGIGTIVGGAFGGAATVATLPKQLSQAKEEGRQVRSSQEDFGDRVAEQAKLDEQLAEAAEKATEDQSVPADIQAVNIEKANAAASLRAQAKGSNDPLVKAAATIAYNQHQQDIINSVEGVTPEQKAVLKESKEQLESVVEQTKALNTEIEKQGSPATEEQTARKKLFNDSIDEINAKIESVVEQIKTNSPPPVAAVDISSYTAPQLSDVPQVISEKDGKLVSQEPEVEYERVGILNPDGTIEKNPDYVTADETRNILKDRDELVVDPGGREKLIQEGHSEQKADNIIQRRLDALNAEARTFWEGQDVNLSDMSREKLAERQAKTKGASHILSHTPQSFAKLDPEHPVTFFERRGGKGKDRAKFKESTLPAKDIDFQPIHDQSVSARKHLGDTSRNALKDPKDRKKLDRLDRDIAAAETAIARGQNLEEHRDKLWEQKAELIWRDKPSFMSQPSYPTDDFARATQLAKLQEEAQRHGVSAREQAKNMNLISMYVERIKQEKDNNASKYASRDNRLNDTVQESIPQIKEKILEIAKQYNINIPIAFAEKLFGAQSQTMNGAQTSEQISEVGGFYTGEMIAIAINSDNFSPYATAHHELFHAAYDLLSAKEQNNLRNAYTGGVGLPDYEHAAYAFQAYVMGHNRFQIGDKTFSVTTKGPFKKIKEFFKRLGNYFKGLGFKTELDIFREVQRGEVGKRSVHHEYADHVRDFMEWYGKGDLKENGHPAIVVQDGEPVYVNEHGDVKSIYDSTAWTPNDKRMWFMSDGLKPEDTVHENLQRKAGRPVTSLDYEKSDPLINWSTVTSESDIRDALARMLVDFNKTFEAARQSGTSVEQMLEKAQEFADHHKLTPQLISKMGDRATASPTETILMTSAVFQVGSNLEKARKKFLDLPPSDVRARRAAAIEYYRAAEAFRYVFETFTAVRSNAGRNLMILKLKEELVNAKIDSPWFHIDEIDDLAKFEKKLQDIDEKDMSIKDLIDTQKTEQKPTWFGKFLEAWLSGLLSSPKTQFVNILSNQVMRMLITGPENFTAALIGEVRTGGAYNRDKASLSEAIKALAYDNLTMFNAAQMAGRAFWVEDGSVRFQSPIDVRRQKQIQGPHGRIIRTPFRTLVAMDEFFKWRAFDSGIISISDREGRKLGLTPAQNRAFGEGVREAVNRRSAVLKHGTQDQKLSQVELNLDGITELDQLNIPNIEEIILDIEAQATHLAAQSTFTERLGPISGQILERVHKAPILRLFMPFVMTPSNIVKNVFRRIPFVALAIRDVREDIFGPKAGKLNKARRDHAIARQVVGSGLLGVTAMLAMSGMITGGGPSEPNERRRWLEAYQPYSMKLGDGWFSFFRLEPFGMIMGLGADFAETMKRLDVDEDDEMVPAIFSALLTSISKNLTSKTWLQGITSIVEALSDPDRYSERVFLSYVGSTIPTLAAHIAMANDPQLKSAGTMLEKLKSRLPILTEDVAPRAGVLGEPIRYQDATGPIGDFHWEQLMNPIYYKGIDEDKKIIDELIANDISLGPASQSKYRGIKLTGWQRYDLGRFRRHLFREKMRELIADGRWYSLPKLGKQKIAEALKRRSSELGNAWFEQKYNFMGTRKKIKDTLEGLRS